MSQDLIVITGPTATGKTALSISLANRIGGEIVSADSMQIYKRMDIGTAKATEEEQKKAVHHMIDIVDPSEPYSVSKYVNQASEICDDIIARGKVPIVTGGTGMYIDSLVKGLTFSEYDADESERIRTELNAQYEEIGGEKMISLLSKFDPDRAKILSPNDKKRIVRAIEVYKLTGETITRHDELSKLREPRYKAKYFVLNFKDREELYKRINLRVDKMMQNGLLEEVNRLLNEGIDKTGTALQAIGYKEMLMYLDGAVTLDEAVEKIKRESRRYAKRQLTWFRKNKDTEWIQWDGEPDLGAGVDKIISSINSEI